ncbi:hypothetical protein SAY87_025303 [Trapa incisa]|uniref:Midasin n=1 Tax=Trapa incisa TaxID=236973 RepID=A0AAN7JGF5_9MYRT|nr:hypothetical protein SAY87_025303 [Trapa incisa]
MAIDGSFSVEYSFRRFLARCPDLANHSQIMCLAEKGVSLTEEDVENAVAEIFLHPSYTIPLIGCFLPLAQKIVENVVSQLRIVSNLRSNSSDGFGLNWNILNEANNGMGLNLHELACFAFCRSLDLAPFLMGPILGYFKFAPPPFERIARKGEDIDLPLKVDQCLVHIVQTSYRMLVLSPESFSKLWDWSCFLDLPKQLVDSSSSTEQGNDAADICWCTSNILSIVFRISDASTKMGICADEAFECFLRWGEFCRDVSLERAGLYIEICEEMKSDATVNVNRDSLLGSLTVSSMALSVSIDRTVSKSQKHVHWDEKYVNTPFVLTSSLKRKFEMVLMAVSQKWPVLLFGPPGVGKSSLISKLAQDSGNDVLFVHMDDQIDGKTLVGNYVCTEKPGEFSWQPGSLTQAVLKGLWIVLEDIDKAPPDVHSILLPLLEGASFFLTGHGEGIKVADSFRLFATISTSRHNAASASNWHGTLWKKIMIKQSNREDLKDIIKAQFPSLEPLSEKLIDTFEMASGGLEHKLNGWNPISTPLGRFSLRDLLKLCKRVVGLGICFYRGCVSVSDCQRIYKEAVDVFASFISSAESGLAMRKEIASIWAVPDSAIEGFYPDYKPVIQDSLFEFTIGRISLQHSQRDLYKERKPFVEIRRSLHAIERIACSVKYNEPVLLVGETGTGKTTLVQNLASRLGQKIIVLNLSQQSDVTDLLGGFKPISPHYMCMPLYKEFEELFSKTFSSTANTDFIVCLQKLLSDKNWKRLLNGLRKGVESFRKYMETQTAKRTKKRKKPFNEEIFKAWDSFSMKLETAFRQLGTSSGMMFSFVEGAFVSALRNGDWVLLDEVNLAPAETLQRISGVLEGEEGSLCLAERGDVSFIKRHPNFRVFACMNPATDAGKRDLPHSIRSRFTEYFIGDLLDDDDLCLFVSRFIDETRLKEDIVKRIVCFYRAAKRESEERLQDGANQKPQYSLRSLFRALEYTRKAKRSFTFENALYDGFCMFFLTLLDRSSAKIMNQMILSYLLKGMDLPKKPNFLSYITMNTNSTSDGFVESYVLTKTVNEQLRNLARAVFIQRYPVLLQGPTSSGKTSLVRYLAAVSGREFVRINNHEHTDLQEYLGSYVTDSTGKLVFHEGVLVRAVREGNWIVLDELNLAPSDVLEALNRLLDDNRELFVPELQETIKAHPAFMLFATQNPPTVYAGRKMLSRAFRNRFVEIHVDEIPEDELTTILEEKCKISRSYAVKMVEVMKDLQLCRQNSNVFAGKHGYITPRDLFRWANRVKKSSNQGVNSIMKHPHEDLAKEGYYLLAERLRDDNEKSMVKEVLKKHFHLSLSEDDLYKQELSEIGPAFNSDNNLDSLRNVIWTKSMWRMYNLIRHCYELREPVLLVGETGGGKTTICQWLSIVLNSKLHILNCHQYTETSDFIGGFYPIRERSRLTALFKDLVEQLMVSNAFVNCSRGLAIPPDIGKASSTIEQLGTIINDYRKGIISPSEVTSMDIDALEQVKLELEKLHEKWQTIFSWQDGPLVQAMKAGHLFLADEISLADDSVLERLNSVLEPERTISLPEKGGSAMEKIIAHKDFFVLATMNPGGDYGKKELSPALRNRFTEIWVPSVTDLDDLRNIASQRISKPEFLSVVDPMTKFWEWFNKQNTGRTLTVRDLISWISFVNVVGETLGARLALLHGVFLVLLDGLSLGTGMHRNDAKELRKKCLQFLLEHIQVDKYSLEYSELSALENYGWGNPGLSEDNFGTENMDCDKMFGIKPFYIERGHLHCDTQGFELLAPTTRRNTLRVLRAMQLRKPVLLEGSPGVGKTSLVVALGRFSGHKVIRINLSEQTDMMDLLGSDLPVESEEEIKFSWSDGILLQALKEGSWVLLDELNLAQQSVLEGLNAILDHRAEVYIPELDQTFTCPPSFRVFACQNPPSQGGGRKGLPKSFLNRFTKVYVDELVEEDYLSISTSLFPSIPKPILLKLILFNKQLFEDTMSIRKFGRDGSPWEFNLRDVIRSCEIIRDAPERSKVDCFLNLVYVLRMRTTSDRREVLGLFEQIFEVRPFINPFPRVQLNNQTLIVGSTVLERNNSHISEVSNAELRLLPSVRLNLEAVAKCVKHGWLCILTGPHSSGKTSLIRMLAKLTGNVLNELNLSSATEISELLGCFEQCSIFRHLRSFASKIEQYINEYSRMRFEHSIKTSHMEANLISRWHSFLSLLNNGYSSGSSFGQVEYWRRVGTSFSLLIEIVEKLKLQNKVKHCGVSQSNDELDRIMGMILKLQEVHQRTTFSSKFEWVTGLLLKAVESGEWIVLEDANLCNPTVLDRINSLVEPSGSMIVNERGSVDGKPVILLPHPKFRMFLTVDPSYGEVSRAMRNRGVEIFMMPPSWLPEGPGELTPRDMELQDVKRFLIQSGISNPYLVDSMAEAHIYARNEGSGLNVVITYFELACWVRLFQQLLINGNRPQWSLHVSWNHTYLPALGDSEGEIVVLNAIDKYLSMKSMLNFDLLPKPLCLPGGWPLPLLIRDFILYPDEASIKQNCMYLEYLGAKYASYVVRQRKISVDQALFHHKNIQALTSTGGYSTYWMDTALLSQLLYSNFTNNRIPQHHGDDKDFDFSLVDRMILFAADWVMEQATDSDLKLYLLWLRWFHSQLLPYAHTLNHVVSSFEEELSDPIWGDIIYCIGKLKSASPIEYHVERLPFVSQELVDLVSSSSCALGLPVSHFQKAINCIPLLRLCYRQWDIEKRSKKFESFKPLLNSLGLLEKDVLKMLPSAPSYDVLVKLCNRLVEDHIRFWDCLITDSVDRMQFFWRCLLKDSESLQSFCPSAATAISVLVDSRNLIGTTSWNLYPKKSLLWIYGGHPLLPPSADIYSAQLKIFRLCDSIWPLKTSSRENCKMDLVASSSTELRSLAVQGIGIASHLSDKDTVHVVEKLEEMYQMLLERFRHEVLKLEKKAGLNEVTCFKSMSASCCSVSPQMFLTATGGDSNSLGPFCINDCTSFFIDMKILQEILSVLLLDPEELHQGLENLSQLLDSALSFSLNYSLRQPQMFSGHQKLLWALDAWHNVNAVNMKIAAFVLEMWFWWHSSMWNLAMHSFRSNGCDFSMPDILTHPFRVNVAGNLDNSISIKDYNICCLRLKVASRNIWRSSYLETEIPSFLVSIAQAAFQQILYAHWKNFTAEQFQTIKSIFVSSQARMTEDDIQSLISLILLSRHQGLRDVVPLFVKPILRMLYIQPPTTEYSIYNMGLAWLHIGGMRYLLLHNVDDLDPAMKYNCKQCLLAEKKSLLELEIKVRQECDYLAGWSSPQGHDERRLQELNRLENEITRMQRKVVFRANPMKFKKLRGELCDFCNHIKAVMFMMENIINTDKQAIIQHICDWQKTSISFVDHLSDEYSDYVDIVQPVQVAIFEIKLGLSLVISSIFEEEFLNKVGEKSINRVMATIHSFMSFPRATILNFAVNLSGNSLDEFYLYKIESPSLYSLSDVRLLEKLVSVTRASHTDDTIEESSMQLKATLHHNVLVQVAQSIFNGRFMSNTSFILLDEIFKTYANLWMDTKVQAKEKQELASQMYRFRTRRVKIESVVEVDISTLGESFENEIFNEWQELASEEGREEIKAADESENLEEIWIHMQESILSEMVKIHIQLFGSTSLLILHGTSQMCYAEMLQSFSECYRLGSRMIKDLSSVKSAVLDATLVPEHLLQLCLDHERNSISPYHRYNFYKDPNTPVMAKMVKFLCALEERVISLLNENENHLGLQKVVDIIKMLLSIPLNTPLTKALSGLQYLLNWGFMVSESNPKLSLADQLDNITRLAISWQKMELDTMPLLLDELQEQYEKNASKLWFPLYSVLHRHSAEVSAYSEGLSQSLQEFILTSSVGDFRTRLQLILAFHGQISTGIQLGIYSSSCYQEHLKILYNLFGLNMQFLPIIMEYVDTTVKSAKKEIKELQTLCRWEQLISMEKSKKIRQKLTTFIKKFSETLEQPVKLVLIQRAAQVGIDMQFLHAPKFVYIFPREDVPPLMECSHNNRFIWCGNWIKKFTNLQSLMPHETCTSLSLFNVEIESHAGVKSVMKKCSFSLTKGHYQKQWGDLMLTLEDISQMICNCGELWKNEFTHIGKKRTFSELLKKLENCGLARHMSLTEDHWLLHSSHDPSHLLLKKDGTSEISSHVYPNGADLEWKTASEYHFKSIVAIQLLQYVSLNFHKDFSLEQIIRSGSFLQHLAVMQHAQRDALYNLSHSLRCLQTYLSLLRHSYEDSSSECIISRDQRTILECLWQQKQLFDGLWNILHEGLFLLKKVVDLHLDTCEDVQVAARKISALFESFIPVVQTSKETLDRSLLKHDGITILDQSSYRIVISKNMEELVPQNFQVLMDLEDGLKSFQKQNLDKSSISHRLIDRLDNILKKGKSVLEVYNSAGSREPINSNDSGINKQEASEVPRTGYEYVADVEHQRGSLFGIEVISDDLQQNIPSWKHVFDSYAAELHVENLLGSILSAIRSAETLMWSSMSEATSPSFHVGSYLKTLSLSMDLILDFGNGLLQDLLALHRMMCIMTHNLANNLAQLFLRGYGNSAEQVEDQSVSQNATGTGMGEGTGVNDVSNQITEEDQLLGDSSKMDEQKDAMGEVPNNNDKGVEMEEDFEADMFSVSTESEDNDDNKEGEDAQIESAMGKTEEESEVIDAKLLQKDEDIDGNNDLKHQNEKYESGSSVQDRHDNSLELRGIEEEQSELGEPQNDGNEVNGSNDVNADQGDTGDAEDEEDMVMEKEDAYMDSTGIEPDELDGNPKEDYQMEELEDANAMEELDSEVGPEEEGLGQDSSPVNEDVEERGLEQANETYEENMENQDHEHKQDIDLTTKLRDLVKPMTSNLNNDCVPTSESGSQLKSDSVASGAINGRQELDQLNNDNARNDLAPLTGQPSGPQSEQDFMLSGQSDAGKWSEDHLKSQFSQDETSTLQQSQLNPYRSIGDALEGWKERAKVHLDLAQNNIEAESGENEDQNAEDYGFVTGLEKGSAQALGPANPDQIDHQPDSLNDIEGPSTRPDDDPVDMEVEMQFSEMQSRIQSASVKQKLEEPFAGQENEKLPEEMYSEGQDPGEGYPKQLESIVHAKRSSNDEILQLSRMNISNDEEVKPLDDQVMLQISDAAIADAASIWRRCEFRTTNLSQELAEQLRLILEPTLASKLQGDYKTGKRINMKKVIPYIASHYRKDKIWLRRNRPNKRDYQVVVAVDDSRSMSEGRCGDVAVEALVTVCRALSQLEMGSLAVVCFGKKGNTQVLHDFDQPFTAEAGIKMISNLTFKQENTLVDEPVVDLLKHLNGMLDANVAKARLPSGQNPLQQLVLIIADGLFHEKESLRRCVRDFLSSNRMVAFLLLDSPKEPIMDHMEVSFQGGIPKFSKYMDSFPFPYYVVLRNIEALPQTLANLLRQWFEIMQN